MGPCCHARWWQLHATADNTASLLHARVHRFHARAAQRHAPVQQLRARHMQRGVPAADRGRDSEWQGKQQQSQCQPGSYRCTSGGGLRWVVVDGSCLSSSWQAAWPRLCVGCPTPILLPHSFHQCAAPPLSRAGGRSCWRVSVVPQVPAASRQALATAGQTAGPAATAAGRQPPPAQWRQAQGHGWQQQQRGRGGPLALLLLCRGCWCQRWRSAAAACSTCGPAGPHRDVSWAAGCVGVLQRGTAARTHPPSSH